MTGIEGMGEQIRHCHLCGREIRQDQSAQFNGQSWEHNACANGTGLLAELTRLRAEVAALRQELRNIAEGNLGDDPWQANYARIRAVAIAALTKGEIDAGK